MSLSRKHFCYMAVEFGSILRDIDSRFTHGSETHEACADNVREAMFSFERMCKTDNPRFDREKFQDFVADVRYERRDLTGKKKAVA
jgi:hypothetical protein